MDSMNSRNCAPTTRHVRGAHKLKLWPLRVGMQTSSFLVKSNSLTFSHDRVSLAVDLRNR